MKEETKQRKLLKEREWKENMAGYTATLVAGGRAGAVMEKVTGAFGQEQ